MTEHDDTWPPEDKDVDPQDIKDADECVERMKEIHERYTTEAMTERLAELGFGPEATGEEMAPAIKEMVHEQLAAYRELEFEYGLPPGFCMSNMEGRERINQHGTDRAHRMRPRVVNLRKRKRRRTRGGR